MNCLARSTQARGGGTPAAPLSLHTPHLSSGGFHPTTTVATTMATAAATAAAANAAYVLVGTSSNVSVATAAWLKA